MANPLDFLQPLVDAGQLVGGAFSAVLTLTALSAFVAPLFVALLVSPVQHGAWKWPALWVVPSLVSALVLSAMLSSNRATLSLSALGVLGLWLLMTTLTGLVRLSWRVLAFVVSGRVAGAHTRFDRALGVLGLLTAALSLCLSAASASGATVGLAALVALLGLVLLRPRHSPSPFPVPARSRFFWLLGTALTALLTPPTLVLAAALLDGAPITIGRGISSGFLLFVFSSLGLLMGTVLLRAARARRAMAVPVPASPAIEGA